MSEDQLQCEGNPNRSLFKYTCLQNSNNSSLSSPNRGIYAALSGNLNVLLENMPELKDNSNSCKWENYLWAYIRSFIETKTQFYIETKLNPTPHSKLYTVSGCCLDSRFSSKWNYNWPSDFFSLIDSSTSQLLTKVSSKASWDPLDVLTQTLSQYEDLTCSDLSSNSTMITNNTTMASQIKNSTKIHQKSIIMNESALRSVKGLASMLAETWHILIRQAIILRDYRDISAISAKLMKVLTIFGLGDISRHPVITIYSENMHDGMTVEPNVSRNLSRAQSINRSNLTMSLRQTRNSINNSRLTNMSTLRNQTLTKKTLDVIEDSQRKPFKELIRFTVYLFTSLRRLEENIDDQTFEMALEVYLAILIADNYPTELILQLISMFKTNERRIAWLSFHLFKLDSPEIRESAISAISSCGFDHKPISFAVIRLLRRTNGILSYDGCKMDAKMDGNLSVNQIFSQTNMYNNYQQTFSLEDEDNLFKCFHWLYFDQNLYVHLLRLVNTAFRSILLNDSDNLDLIERIHEKIPSTVYELVQIQLKQNLEKGTSEEQLSSREEKMSLSLFKTTLNEHHSYLLYFEFMKEFNTWYKMYNSGFSMKMANGPLKRSKSNLKNSIVESDLLKSQTESQDKWTQDLKVQAIQAQKKLLDMWSCPCYGWLKDPETQGETDKFYLDRFDDEIDHVIKAQRDTYENTMVFEYAPIKDVDYLGERVLLRHEQLSKLRSNLIVKSTNQLVKILQCSNLHQDCLQLADLLVDPRLNLYEHFTKNQLSDLLKELANSSIILHSEFEDAFGYVT